MRNCQAATCETKIPGIEIEGEFNAKIVSLFSKYICIKHPLRFECDFSSNKMGRKNNEHFTVCIAFEN